MFLNNLFNRRNLCAGALLLFILGGANVVPAKAAQTPEQTVQSFYKWYLRELFANGNPIDDKAMMSKYVSKRLNKQIRAEIAREEYDADYFIDAQDYDENWTVNISNTSIKGTGATLKVLLAAPKGKKSQFNITLAVRLIKENGAWKIDRVNGR